MQSKLTFPSFGTNEPLPQGYSLIGAEPINVPTLDLSKSLSKKRDQEKKKEIDDEDSYDEECGNPCKKKKINKSKAYSVFAQIVKDKEFVGPKEKRGYKRGILYLKK
ncbi:MAG TPA: hypothetical protein VER35_03465 [Candidatus Limnocylindrales bacterium]|nr:hypothetical protein [Candidatus Limnocylindrales bacterium]